MSNSLVFDIKRYAINDGPGIRVTVFLKGCPLSCVWCHNPESLSPRKQKMYTHSKCIGCGYCVKACRQNACELTPGGIVTNKDICIECGKCAEVCPTKATEMSGEEMTVAQIMTSIKKETLLMDQSEGGVTFSGGEPLMHHKMLVELLDECRAEGIHSCVDTTGFASTDVFTEVAKRADYFLYDLKMMNSERHRQYTGVPNEKIISNLKLLSELGVKMNIRIPLIKGVNDDDENIEESAKLIASLAGSAPKVNILPYHATAINKHTKLGQNHNQESMNVPDNDRVEQVLALFTSYGVEASVGG